MKLNEIKVRLNSFFYFDFFQGTAECVDTPTQYSIIVSVAWMFLSTKKKIYIFHIEIENIRNCGSTHMFFILYKLYIFITTTVFQTINTLLLFETFTLCCLNSYLNYKLSSIAMESPCPSARSVSTIRGSMRRLGVNRVYSET